MHVTDNNKGHLKQPNKKSLDFKKTASSLFGEPQVARESREKTIY